MNIFLTDSAAKKIKEFKKQDNLDDMILRVKVSGGGCSGFVFDLFFDLPKEDDLHVSSNDVDMIVDEISIQYLDGISIDYIETLHGAGFKFSGGEIKSSCGCGNSVSF